PRGDPRAGAGRRGPRGPAPCTHPVGGDAPGGGPRRRRRCFAAADRRARGRGAARGAAHPGGHRARPPRRHPRAAGRGPRPDGGTGVLMDVALERVWVVEDKKVEQKSHTYLAGTRSVANPKRASAEAELLTLQRDDEEREAAVAQQVRRFVAAGQDVTRSLQSLEVCRERARESCEQRYAKCMEKAVDGGAEMRKAAEQCRGGCEGLCASEERELARARKDAATIET